MWGDWAVQGIGKGSQQLGFLEGDASIGPDRVGQAEDDSLAQARGGQIQVLDRLIHLRQVALIKRQECEFFPEFPQLGYPALKGKLGGSGLIMPNVSESRDQDLGVR